jgi:hypothetical protein
MACSISRLRFLRSNGASYEQDRISLIASDVA